MIHFLKESSRQIDFIDNCLLTKQSINLTRCFKYIFQILFHHHIVITRLFYPGKKNILRIASAANIENQKIKILNPFDNFGSFIIK
jgi:hypothetical protein